MLVRRNTVIYNISLASLEKNNSWPNYFPMKKMKETFSTFLLILIYFAFKKVYLIITCVYSTDLSINDS